MLSILRIKLNLHSFIYGMAMNILNNSFNTLKSITNAKMPMEIK